MILKGGTHAAAGVIAKRGPNAGHGITPAQIGAAGNAASPLANDIDAGDTSTEFLFVLLPPLATSGTTLVNDAAGYGLVNPANGSYTQNYRVLYMPATGSPGVYQAVIDITVGSGSGQAGPRFAVRRTTGEVMTLLLDDAGVPYAARRANGAVIPLDLVAGAMQGRAVLQQSGEIVVLV